MDSNAGEKLSFCVDGPSLHLVMGASNEGREGIGFRVVDVPADKRPNEENPYRSVAHVLCGNIRQRTGQQCKKKVRACLLDFYAERIFLCFLPAASRQTAPYVPKSNLRKNCCAGGTTLCYCCVADTLTFPHRPVLLAHIKSAQNQHAARQFPVFSIH